jgi:hypothetical protein
MADIITLDRNLKKQLRCMNKLPEMKKRLFKLEQLLATAKTLKKNRQITILEMSCSKLREDIHDIELADALQMYTIETVEIIEKFKKILARPVQMSFMGPIKVDTTEKDNLVKRYMSIYNRYMKKINCNPPEQVSEAQEDNTSKRPKQPVVCSVNGCTSTKFSVVDQLRVCERCSTVQSDLTNPTSSYSDIDRINISSKYLYDRKIHFRDCILQFQGRQNVTIDKSVYDALENEFEKHHLLIGDSNTPIHIRFSKITKEHISIFLKELRLSKHYENVQLIHYNLTGIAPPDISHLEGALLQDFEKLTALYDDIHKKDTRKNFINTAYVLYQLLRRHKFDCDASDFSILKTSERRDWHHRICRNLFSILNWNFSAI